MWSAVNKMDFALHKIDIIYIITMTHLQQLVSYLYASLVGEAIVADRRHKDATVTARLYLDPKGLLRTLLYTDVPGLTHLWSETHGHTWWTHLVNTLRRVDTLIGCPAQLSQKVGKNCMLYVVKYFKKNSWHDKQCITFFYNWFETPIFKSGKSH